MGMNPVEGGDERLLPLNMGRVNENGTISEIQPAQHSTTSEED